MEIFIGLFSVIFIYFLFKFFSGVKLAKPFVENTYERPVEPEPSKDLAELPEVKNK